MRIIQGCKKVLDLRVNRFALAEETGTQGTNWPRASEHVALLAVALADVLALLRRSGYPALLMTDVQTLFLTSNSQTFALLSACRAMFRRSCVPRAPMFMRSCAP